MAVVKSFDHLEINYWLLSFNSFPSNYNNNQTSVASIPSAASNVIGSSALTSTSGLAMTSPSNITDLKESSGCRKARVLYDYDAANSSELSLLADEVKMSQIDMPYSI